MRFAALIKRIRDSGIRTRLVAYFLLFFGALFILVLTSVYYYIAHAHRGELDAALYNYAVELSHSVPDDNLRQRRQTRSLHADADLILPFSLHDVLLQIDTEDGETVLQSDSLHGKPLPPPSQREKITSKNGLFRTIDWQKGAANGTARVRYRAVFYRFERPGLGGFDIQVAIPSILIERQQQQVLVFFLTTVPLILAFATLGAMTLSRNAMEPVAAMTEKANAIEARHLAKRIPVPAANDEIRELALTLNGLLDRLQAAFHSQEAFVANASHQLKTPLAILKGEFDVFSQGSRSAADLEIFLRSARQEIGSLIRLVEELLLLAGIENAGEETREPFRLDEQLMDSIARYSKMAESRQISLSMDLQLRDEESEDEPCRVAGDPDLIRTALDNLIDNALKYSPSGSTVALSIEDRPDECFVRIRDQGPGIAEQDIDLVFHRFFRSQASRSTVPGSGLGLSIARKIIERHGGTIALRNLPERGLEVVIKMPKANSPFDNHGDD